MFAGDEMLVMRKLTARICEGFVATVERQSLSLKIVEIPTRTVEYREIRQEFAYAHAIAVSWNGLFLTIDFEFGITKCYRIRYNQKKPFECVPISDFSWKMRVRSVPNGVHCIVASALERKLVLWELLRGNLHRVLEFESEILCIAQDEEYGVWVATEGHVYLVSINGLILAKSEITKCVVTMQAIPRHRSETARTLVCGTTTGEIYLLMPLFATGKIDFNRLPSPHERAVEKIVLNPSGKSFVSIDADEICYRWSVPGMKARDLRIGCYGECGVCGGQPPVLFCASCNRAVCGACGISGDGCCSLCSGIDVY
jgi:WD40 repeat protein